MQEAGSLKQKTISGMSWSLFDLLARQGINFFIQIVLARLLMPKDFGIMGMIAVFIAVSQQFINSGFSNGLIREKDVSQEEYSTVFFFNIFMAMITYGILFAAAGTISRFFNEPLLVPVLRVLGWVLIIDAVGMTQVTILTRKVDFRTQSLISVIAGLVSGGVGIVMAYGGFGVWSLVVRSLLLQFFQTLLLCIRIRWQPSLVFRLEAFKRLFDFGWKLLLSSLLSTLYSNLYYLIIGKIYSATDLGYYANARKLSDTVVQSATSAVDRVSYPVLSSIKEDRDRLKQVYQKLIKTSVFLSFPVMFVLAATADSLIGFLFGEKWLPSIPYFRIICFSGMLYPLHSFNLNILQVQGRSDLFLGLSVIKKIIGLSFIGLVIYFRLGIIWLLWTAVLDSYLVFFINSRYSAKLLDYSSIEQIRDVLPSYLAALLMGAVVYVMGLILPFVEGINLLLQITAGFLIYMIVSKLAGIAELGVCLELLATVIKRLLSPRGA